MWKRTAYLLLIVSLVVAAVLTWRMEWGFGNFHPRVAWILFLAAAFLGYFRYWRRGPGPAEHSEDGGEGVS